jgi:hypothetical protein
VHRKPPDELRQRTPGASAALIRVRSFRHDHFNRFNRAYETTSQNLMTATFRTTNRHCTSARNVTRFFLKLSPDPSASSARSGRHDLFDDVLVGAEPDPILHFAVQERAQRRDVLEARGGNRVDEDRPLHSCSTTRSSVTFTSAFVEVASIARCTSPVTPRTVCRESVTADSIRQIWRRKRTVARSFDGA